MPGTARWRARASSAPRDPALRPGPARDQHRVRSAGAAAAHGHAGAERQRGLLRGLQAALRPRLMPLCVRKSKNPDRGRWPGVPIGEAPAPRAKPPASPAFSGPSSRARGPAAYRTSSTRRLACRVCRNRESGLRPRTPLPACTRSWACLQARANATGGRWFGCAGVGPIRGCDRAGAPVTVLTPTCLHTGHARLRAWAGERTAGPPAPAKPTRGPNGTNRLLFFRQRKRMSHLSAPGRPRRR